MVWTWALALVPLSGCHPIPVTGTLRTDSTANLAANVTAGFQGTVDVRLPAATDPGPVVAVVVRPSSAGPEAPRISVLDVDGLILNQNLTGLYSVGENPVAALARSWKRRAETRASARSSCGFTVREAGSRPPTSWPRSCAGFGWRRESRWWHA